MSSGSKHDLILLLYQPEKFTIGYLLSQTSFFRNNYILIPTLLDFILFVYFAIFLLIFDIDLLNTYTEGNTTLIAFLYFLMLLYYALFYLFAYLLGPTPLTKILTCIVSAIFIRGLFLAGTVTYFDSQNVIFSALLLSTLIASVILGSVTLGAMNLTKYIPISKYAKEIIHTVFQPGVLYPVLSSFYQSFQSVTIDKLFYFKIEYMVSTILFITPLFILSKFISEDSVKIVNNELYVTIAERPIRTYYVLKLLHHYGLNDLGNRCKDLNLILSINLNKLTDCFQDLGKDVEKIHLYLSPSPKMYYKEINLVKKIVLKRNEAHIWISEDDFIQFIRKMIEEGNIAIENKVKEKISQEIHSWIRYRDFRTIRHMFMLLNLICIITVFLSCSIVPEIQRPDPVLLLIIFMAPYPITALSIAIIDRYKYGKHSKAEYAFSSSMNGSEKLQFLKIFIKSFAVVALLLVFVIISAIVSSIISTGIIRLNVNRYVLSFLFFAISSSLIYSSIIYSLSIKE